MPEEKKSMGYRNRQEQEHGENILLERIYKNLGKWYSYSF